MSTTAVAAESNQLNFNPSWMRPVTVSTSGGDGNVASSRIGPPTTVDNRSVDYPVADPIFVKNRYGREDLLALLSKDAHPPDGLEKCQFYVAVAQKPIVLMPLSEIETRLQQNINSSKAMGLLNHADRATIASGGMIGGPNIPAQLRTSQESRSFSPSWISASGVGGGSVGRGNAPFSRGGAFGSSFRGRIQTSSTRGGRGGAASVGRGVGTVQPFNARAQGLYDPRDPRDRPRQRFRSTSDDTSNPSLSTSCTAEDISTTSVNGGWTQVGRTAAPWSKRIHASTNATAQQQTNTELTVQSQLPEWMGDDHEKERSSNLEETGSFDDSGQFRTSASVRRIMALDLSATPNVSVNVSERQQLHQEEKATITSIDAVAARNAWSVLPNSLEPQGSKIANHFSEKPDASLTLTSEHSVPTAMTGTVVRNAFNQKYSNDICLLHHSMSQPSTVGLSSHTNDYCDDWYYVDPKNAVQGPFPTNHMQAWYKLGYFTSELRVRHGQNSDSGFITLGELITVNGEDSPFKSKPLPSSVIQLPLQQTQEVSRNIWSRDYSASLLEAAKVKEERQKLEEEQRRMAEQERQLKVMREALLKDEEERLERERQIMEKELQLQRAQEELARLAAEEKERAAAREREIEAERKRLAEEMERAKKEEVEKALAETRRKEEEKEKERLKTEAEKQVREAKEQKRKQEEATKKATANQERSLQQSSANEKENGPNKTKQTATKNFAVTEKYMSALRQKAAQDTSTNRPYSWQVVYRTGEEKFISPKTAPWVAAKNVGTMDRSEPSLLDIQQEEERQMIAEKKQKEHMNELLRKNPIEAARVGVWGSASQKLVWKQNSQVLSAAANVPSRQVAWSGAGAINNKFADTNPLWDGPSPDNGTKAKTDRNPNSANRAERSSMPNHGSTEQEDALKKFFKQSVTSDNALSSWMINQLKGMNPQVDADVFAAFIEGVDNPHEVEDYIIGYLGDSHNVRELIREFLERRSQARKKKGPIDKDDLTHPAHAADAVTTSVANTKFDSATSQQVVTGGKKKKKGNKGNKLVVDGACLGFKGTADPNRVNIGEIDMVGAGSDYLHK